MLHSWKTNMTIPSTHFRAENNTTTTPHQHLYRKASDVVVLEQQQKQYNNFVVHGCAPFFQTSIYSNQALLVIP